MIIVLNQIQLDKFQTPTVKFNWIIDNVQHKC